LWCHIRGSRGTILIGVRVRRGVVGSVAYRREV
jgi:hypothetical protein